MKKMFVMLSIFTLVLFVTLVTYFNSFKTTNIYIEDSINEKTKIAKSISMNLEQTEGAGDYKTVTQSEWPTEGYKFNKNLSKCENGSELSWDKENKTVVISGVSADKCYVYFDIWISSIADYCESGTDLATCVKNFGDQGSDISNIYIHNSSLTNGAGDNSYRYAGPSDSVNNFVCFGSDAETCPKDNLYRIIGVFDENYHGVSGKHLVKLIKADYAKSNLLGTDGDYYGSSTPSSSTYKGSLSSVNTYYWNYKNDTTINNGYGSNTWSTSLLNKTNLNTNFINNIGSDWANKIATTTWKVGGGTYANIGNSVPSKAYQYEVGANASTTTSEAKIGLMYVSDYYYAASPSAWTLVGYNFRDETKDYSAATSSNWMYMGYADWTISHYSDDSTYVFTVNNTGDVRNSYVIGRYGGRPVFNLESTVAYVSGTGTSKNPIRIN